MKIAADRSLCKGHGQCELFASDYFEIDDDALVVLLKDQVASGDESAVQEAVTHCPELALRLEQV
ncbi:ferredoxin [Cryptosporangium sp. NPDC051539]|uniref:ferredoxin n=1 Tax=Cryptosporangium sp. NPDC051539 TaxID=3363962 RepID=UPI0037B50538